MNTKRELVEFLTKTNNINGVSFAGIKGYENSKGEIANVQINLGASIWSAKAKDLENFKKLELLSFWSNNVTDKVKFPFALFEKAYINVFNSLVEIDAKLYDGTVKTQNTRSKAQTNAYTVINNSVKVHNEKEQLYLYGLQISKTVIVEGEYKHVNSRPLTIAQNMLKKGMKHTKFRMYIIDKADVMNLAKSSFKGSDLSINLHPYRDTYI